MGIVLAGIVIVKDRADSGDVSRDTITEDLVMGSMVTVSVGLGVLVLITAVHSDHSVAASFRMLEVMIDDLLETNILSSKDWLI